MSTLFSTLCVYGDLEVTNKVVRFDTKEIIRASYIHIHVVLHGTSVSMRAGPVGVEGSEKQNRTPRFSLTATVLASLLISWHCACHTWHLVGRRPLWHQYRSPSSPQAQLEVFHFLGKWVTLLRVLILQ